MDTRVRVALLLLLGMGVLCNPFYLWPHYAADAHELRASGPVTADSARTIPVDSLPPETAAAVESAVDTFETADDLPDGWLREDRGGGHDWPRYESREAVPTDGLFETPGEVVVVDGVGYSLSVVEVDRSPSVLPEAFRIPVGFAGTLALALGALTARRGTAQLSTRTAWTVVGAWTAVLLATAAYDGGVAGTAIAVVREVPLTDVELSSLAGGVLGTTVWLFPAIGLVVGVGLRRERWRSGVGGSGELLAVLAFVCVTWPFTLPGAALGFLLGADRAS